jgi:hypothetical protein
MSGFKVHRITATMVVIATIGSFIIELQQAISHWIAKVDTTISDKRICNWTVYAAAIRKLRAGPKPTTASRVKLGEDFNFQYYFDYETNNVTCMPVAEPDQPRIEPALIESGEAAKREMLVLLAVVIVVVCGIGMKIIDMIRGRASRN